MVGLADECSSTLGYWCAFGCSVFPIAIPEAAQIVETYLNVRLEKIDEHLAHRDMWFLDGEGVDRGLMQYVNIADCVL